MDGVSLPIPMDLQLLKDMLVVDVIYQPIATPWLTYSKPQGNLTDHGLRTLLYQAAESFKHWTGQEVPKDMISKKLEGKIIG